MLNSCWSNTKRFLCVLVVFGKYFVFAKIVKIFKNSVALFWRLSRGLVQSHAPVTSLHRDFSPLTSGSMSQSRKILRIFFKILGLYVSRGSIWRLVRGWKVQLQGVHRDFRGSPRDFLASRLSSGEKHLEKFSNFWFLGFSRLVLMTCTRLGSVAKIVCFAYWGLFSRSFSKSFHLSLMHYYHCSYLHLLPSFLIDPFVYSCQKRGEYTISCAHL